MKHIVFIVFLFFMLLSADILAAVECDNPDAPESVRIYFANGMSNTRSKTEKNKEELREVLRYISNAKIHPMISGIG
ncbi:MAG: hypothetical protein CSA34_06530 [Desulfobulbus propionicus]|nr:MAG: hypothetical protein CSA34_06530 [Desulfobulbus propionicus]